jgi:hypothetical protein
VNCNEKLKTETYYNDFTTLLSSEVNPFKV